MKKFRYRLDRVLQYREVVRADKKRALGLLRQELDGARRQLQKFEQDLLADRLGAGVTVTVEELLLIGAYIERLRDSISRQKLHVLDCEEKVAQALSEYIEAAKEAESLIKHKQGKHTEYREMADKEEQNFLDELTTQRMGRSLTQ